MFPKRYLYFLQIGIVAGVNGQNGVQQCVQHKAAVVTVSSEIVHAHQQTPHRKEMAKPVKGHQHFLKSARSAEVWFIKCLSIDSPPVSCPPFQYSCPKMSNNISSCHDITWHQVTWQSELSQVNYLKIMFFYLATLTLDLWPWHSN